MTTDLEILEEEYFEEGYNGELGAGFDPASGKWEVIVKYNGNIQRLEDELGVLVEVLDADYAIITLFREQIDLLYNFREVEYIEIPKWLYLLLDGAMERSCIPPVQNERGAYRLSGEGIIVAVTDSGIDYRLPDFRNEDGTTRILYLWDQTAEGTPPAGFHRGAEYSKEQIDAVLSGREPPDLVPEVDYVGHGTAVTGIAAGNGRSGRGPEMGAAPKASLLIVKLGERSQDSFSKSTNMMRAIKYVIEKAQELNMPVAVNISYGSNHGSHSGESLFDSFVSSMSEKWKTVIVVASGNEGAAGHHFFGQIETGQVMDVEFVTSGDLPSFYLTLWKNFVDTFSFELIAPNGSSSGTIRYNTPEVFFRSDGIAVYIFYRQPTHYNEDQEVFFQFLERERNAPGGLWRLRVRGDMVVDGRFNIWLPTVEEVSENTAFIRPYPGITLTLPSTAKNALTVGGYNSASSSAAIFSGRGFTRTNVYVKPDLTAPAIDVLSTRTGGGYDTFTGTSMAAPFVTGAAALMMEWGIARGNDPFLYGQRVKAFLQKGARREHNIPYPNSIWGYGTLCLRDTMDELSNYVLGGR